MGVMLVAAPDIRIFEQLPDNGRLFREDLSQMAQHRAQTAIARILGDRGFTIQQADPQTLPEAELDEISVLFRSVNRSIQLHTYGPQIFPDKMDKFEYSVGSISELLNARHADGLVLAMGYQTGIKTPEKNWFSVAVVEPQGTVIWYNLTSSPQRFNFQHREAVSALVAETMHPFWERGS